MDFQPIIEAIITLLGTIITGLIAIYVPRLIAAFETKIGIQLTDQQRAIVFSAAQTAAGIVQTKLDQGLLKITDIHIDNPVIRQEAGSAITRVRDSAEALSVNKDILAAIIVGKVDTSAKTVPVTTNVSPPTTQTSAKVIPL